VQGNNLVTAEALTVLGWLISCIGVLIFGVCTLVFFFIVRIWNKVEETGNKLHELIGKCETNHGHGEK